MKILVIGGSQFVGRAFVTEALARGHEVTTFNRGVSAADLPGVEAVHGDREVTADLERLVAGGRHWDAVVDTCGYVPRVVGEGARVLSGHADAYLYVSSLAALRGWGAAPSVDDDSPAHDCPPDAGPDDGDYGVLKAGCERAVTRHFDGRTLLFRAGVITGPYDNVGQLDAWLWRLRAAEGGRRRVLAPGNPDLAMRVIDARDIAAFGLHCLDARRTGPYIVAAPEDHTTYGAWLAACAEATGTDPELEWVDDDFLLGHGVTPWTDLPMWIPDAPEHTCMWATPATRAEAAGLVCRPPAETVRDTWAVLRDRPAPELPLANTHGHLSGLAAGRERELLAAWDARRGPDTAARRT
ncbi:NAD-dependent epimerase/dehydratase family protein [Streptomyces sp. HU2014]|uniref:NAD-dependent epimerase/dehydratase family protein n=1 Tax=Streptomyces sp. HU2014 TaxID=2939414 RepID=UPI00200EA6CF|nr:NAD-dependent epimerase/dehydratase family protein [Streptomyces sp. HU2014]UQI47362.1 NAD-dependent epimerase/dehydratase family protein [Streptomyces sp. HU2014]